MLVDDIRKLNDKENINENHKIVKNIIELIKEKSYNNETKIEIAYDIELLKNLKSYFSKEGFNCSIEKAKRPGMWIDGKIVGDGEYNYLKISW